MEYSVKKNVFFFDISFEIRFENYSAWYDKTDYVIKSQI